MKEEKIFYKNGNEKICGILSLPEKASRNGIILLHGFTGNKDEEGNSNIFPALAKALCKEGFNVLRFDCRGSGESDGKFEDMTFSSEVSDLKRSIEFMREKNDKTAVVGASFGGGVTLLAYEWTDAQSTSVRSMDCIVLWYPLIYAQASQRLRSLHDVFKEKGKVMIKNSAGKSFYVGKNLYEEWQTVDPPNKLKDVKCPILIVTGTNDKYAKDAKKAMKKIKAEKKIELIEGAYHCWWDKNNKLVEEYRQQATNTTVEWIKKWL